MLFPLAAAMPAGGGAIAVGIVLAVALGGVVAYAVCRRKRASTVLRRAEQQLPALLQHADCLLWEADVEMTGDDWTWEFVLQPSALSRRLFKNGLPSRDVGLWYHFEVPERAAMDDRSREALLKGRPGYDQEFRLIRDGTVTWLRESVAITRSGPGRFWLVGFLFARLRFVVILAGIGLVLLKWDTLQGYYEKYARHDHADARRAHQVVTEAGVRLVGPPRGADDGVDATVHQRVDVLLGDRRHGEVHRHLRPGVEFHHCLHRRRPGQRERRQLHRRLLDSGQRSRDQQRRQRLGGTVDVRRRVHRRVGVGIGLGLGVRVRVRVRVRHGLGERPALQPVQGRHH